MANQVAQAAMRVKHELHGVVVSAGLMQKTVKVRVGNMTWNKMVKKDFSDPKHYLVHDPNSSLRAGDVVSIVPGWRTSQHKRHVVKQIIAPYGTPIEERPPIPTLEERIAEYEAERAVKVERRTAKKATSSEEALAARKRKKEAIFNKMTPTEKEEYLAKQKEKALRKSARQAGETKTE